MSEYDPNLNLPPREQRRVRRSWDDIVEGARPPTALAVASQPLARHTVYVYEEGSSEPTMRNVTPIRTVGRSVATAKPTAYSKLKRVTTNVGRGVKEDVRGIVRENIQISPHSPQIRKKALVGAKNFARGAAVYTQNPTILNPKPQNVQSWESVLVGGFGAPRVNAPRVKSVKSTKPKRRAPSWEEVLLG